MSTPEEDLTPAEIVAKYTKLAEWSDKDVVYHLCEFLAIRQWKRPSLEEYLDRMADIAIDEAGLAPTGLYDNETPEEVTMDNGDVRLIPPRNTPR